MTKVEPRQLPDEPKAPMKTKPDIKLEEAKTKTDAQLRARRPITTGTLPTPLCR